MKKYSIILADPPWSFKNYNDKTASKWVGNKYKIMTIEDICNLPIKDITAESCVLFLWTTPPTVMEYALRVIEEWGFVYKTKAFCWVKYNKNNYSTFMGMGYWTRSNTEDCLLCVKGKPKRENADVRQLIQYPRGTHSEKPPETRDRIIRLCGNLPRIELFARQKTEGWDSIGYDIDGIDIKESIEKLL